MRIFLLAVIAVYACCVAPANAEHPCAKDAIEHAKKLIRLHDEGNHQDSEIADGTRAAEVQQVRAPKGNGMFDVLEVTAAIYKATYRMHFIYMRTDGCPLVGQEILELVGPTG